MAVLEGSHRPGLGVGLPPVVAEPGYGVCDCRLEAVAGSVRGGSHLAGLRLDKRAGAEWTARSSLPAALCSVTV